MARGTVALGTTGMEITRVGLGTWAIGGGAWSYAWGPQDDDESIATIHRAVEAGINWVDTAAEYGLGHSEEVVGRAVRALPEPDRPLVFTKCGLAWDSSDRMKPTRAVASARSLREECEDSLRRLGVERIDLLQVHWPPSDGTPVEAYWPTMLELRQEGKIRAAGLSNHDVAALQAAEALGHVDTLQPPLSLLDRQALSDVIPWCAANDVGVIVYSPMHSGLLSGHFDAERVASLPDDDWRRRSDDFTGRLASNLEVVATLRALSEQLGTNPGELAVAWTLSRPGVTGAIVGARRPAQIKDWLNAGEIQLTPESLRAIAAAVRSADAGSGPLPEA
jgi:aryl-alcohol dehydrogenase-like predicted oxidoreductase